ncbi:TIGR01459 family HAD-type hydrolase [Hyphomonas sp. FCG-A18]|uniref:TIGR01459 family HAD-type hydrolase n=1 Tax=Hyphomonas sp. FCG-A18 TaxID=3080019 RepID=UPI002B2E2C5C|nr:TIGR01459 family HAD-type hydrolase [Hyphomonas sp. FCG-A18]
MSNPKFPGGLAAIADRYDVILCDVWGVIHNGRYAFDEACQALMRFREQGGAVCLITNAPVPKAQVIRYFDPLGVPPEAFDDCVSSGDATRDLLGRSTEQVFWRLGADEGWEHDKFLYEGLNLQFADMRAADTVLCIGLEDQVNDEPEDYRGRLAEAADRGMNMICANPDKKVRIGDQLYWCAGALAEVFEQEGGQVIYPGKPHSLIYDLALAKLGDLGVEPGEGRVLCIGDSPATDMQGAASQGFDGLYVGTGLKQHGADFASEVTSLLSEYNTKAEWAMPHLAW